MTKTPRPALLLASVLCAALLLGAAAPVAARADRPASIKKALDYIYARQLSTGGIASSGASDAPGTTPWAILAIVAGQENPGKWNKDGNDPIDYLQSLNLENTARLTRNPPAFYAKTILAYAASDRSELIWSAGTPRIDLLAKLLVYRYDVEDDPDTPEDEDIDGHFSLATSGDRGAYDVSTTTWALLALDAADQQSDSDVVAETRSWLLAAQNEDGGWSLQTSETRSNVDQTAVVIQALREVGVGSSNTALQRGVGFLRAAQRNDGGFPQYLSDVRSYAESTAWTVQAIEAVGQDPADWVKNGTSPLKYLRGLQRANGSFAHSKNDTGANAMMSTTQSLIALSGRAFTFSLGSTRYEPNHVPSFTSFKPSNGAVFTSTNDVAVTAEYKDTKDGTGIDVDRVRVFVDGVNQTAKAKIGAAKLSIKLVDLRYGQHSIELRIADRAGNRKTSTHTVTVSYTSDGGTSGGSGDTYYPPPSSGTRTPTPTTTLYPTPAATPGSGLTPTPVPSGSGAVTGTPLSPGPSGSPAPEPSATAQSTGGGEGGGSGGLLGGTLLAMLPLGAGLSYWLHRRQAAALSGAGQGQLLAGGGSPWQRLKGRLPGAS